VRLLQDGERVCGAVIRSADGRQHTVHATRGVVLACGGFPHDKGRIAQLFAHAPTGDGHFSAAPPSNTGDGLRLGEMVAGEVIAPGPAAGAWAPVSRVPRRDGSVGHFPHLLERAKPGLIAVTPTGQRFANEANSYFDVMSALLATGHRSAWLLCDHRFIRRYGLGHAKPAPVPLRASLRSGYLQRGHTLAELAQACGIDETSLQATVAQYNDGARRGVDAQFQRGDTPYNRVQGDASQQPNPCVAPLEHGPFYAVQIVPGSLGTFAGLRTDEHARVQRADGSAIAGLYAVGNDQASLMGGRYPSGGITLGPGMTFGFIAAHHAAGVPSDFAAGVPNDFAADMPHEQATSAAP
jgi:succinate dehydrogenase/fumarate reductase flavoprotein subunit